MKSYFFTLFLFLNVFSIIAQTENVTKKIPIYFGCESYKDNASLKSCMNTNLSKDIQNQIKYFSSIVDYLQVENAETKVKFKINKEGKFSDVYVEGENPIFNSVALSSLILLQDKMNKTNLFMHPAIDDKNSPIDINMSLPLRYESGNKDNDFKNFPSYQRVLFTLTTPEEEIEIRIDKDFNLKTYGNNGDREYYLGKFENLFELAVVNPYADAFEKGFKTGVIDVTKGVVDEKLYKIMLKNFFSNSPNAEILIIVYSEENGVWSEYYEFKTKKEFNLSKFAKLTYR